MIGHQMSLRHAVLAALLHADGSGYELTKTFDVAVANFWTAFPQQLYAELIRLESAGLIVGREVVQERRPNKRIFSITEAGREALRDFIDTASKPTFIRDDLLVKVHAAEVGDLGALIEDLTARAQQARAKAEILDAVLTGQRGGRSEAAYLADSPHIGPYLTALRGLHFERETAAWCERVIDVLAARRRTASDAR